MKAIILSILVIFIFQLSAQNVDYSVSEKNPYGQPNPNAPQQIEDFAPMIGDCDCKSLRRNSDGTWQDTLNMVWRFKYILNGMAIQDETWHENDFYATSIRQFNTDSLNWVVSFYGTRFISNKVSVWHGNKIGDDIVLKMPQKSPNGLDGINRLTFFDVSEDGFKWKGEWTNLDESIVYPFWMIDCKKIK
jgi:hypothetical protein